jgi:hypothetical protein
MLNKCAIAIATTMLIVPALACAAPDSGDAPSPSSASDPGWAYSATGMYYFPHGQDNFLLAIGSADRGSLHLGGALQLRGAQHRLAVRRLDVLGRRQAHL